jgi:hypothetical protein
MNPHLHTKIFLAREKKAQQLRLTANVSFIRGIKAGAKAARELIVEGKGDSVEFESLVLDRIRKRRQQD